MPYSPQTARFGDIALALKRRVAAAVVIDTDTGRTLDPAYVRLVASDSYKAGAISEPVFVLIRYYGPQPFGDAGAGRRAMPVTRRLRLFVYVRSSLDRYGDDTEALAAEGTGLADREEAVYEALVNHFAASEDELTALLIEPLHPVDTADGPPVRSPIDDNGLLWSALDFECRYLLRVTTADPPE